ENRADLIKKASRVLKEGGLVIYPTDTLYGLGGNALDKSAVKKVFMAKEREASSPLPIAVSSIEMMKEYSEFSKKAEILARAFLPGALTIVLKKKNLPDTLTGGLPKVGIRIPRSDIALGLVERLGMPITATSANISGRDPPASAEEAALQIKSAGIVLNGGKMQNRVPSTVIDLTGKPKILREGAVRRIELEKVIGEVL
ncbi:MAG: L-threonylcarbamoyladenylate synthase, partial [Candidatus Hydrothermarchaeaceae archaeon]